MFTRKIYREAIINSLKYCQKEKGLVVFAYCIMSHNNPVEAGLVRQEHEWTYSSASNYQEIESIIEVERISQRLITY